jgi:hypothetical protein
VALIPSNLTKKDKYMTKVDLSDYKLSELKELQADIEKEVKTRQQQDVTKAREQIFAIAHSLGVSVEELLADGGKNRKAAEKRCKCSTRTQLTTRRRGPVVAGSQGGLLKDWLEGSR